MAQIKELWSARHEEHLARFLRAVEVDDVVEASLALDMGARDAWDAAVEAALPRLRRARDAGMAMGVAAEIASLFEREWRVELDPCAEVAREGEVSSAFALRSASPRTLALMWAHVARRVGMKACWLEMSVFHPLRLWDEDSEVLVDTTSGALVSPRDCQEIFAAVTEGEEIFEPSMLDNPSARSVACSILEFRLAGAIMSGDEIDRWRVARFHVELKRDHDETLFAAAMNAMSVGDYGFAQSALEELTIRCAGTSLEGPVRQGLEALRLRQQYAN